jgi:hypothetical protein
MAASLDDLAWLAQRLEQGTRRDESEMWRSPDPEELIWQQNTVAYLDFLMRLLPAKAALEAAHIQDRTNRELVSETKGLATSTIVLAVVAVATLIASVAFWIASQ